MILDRRQFLEASGVAAALAALETGRTWQTT
jgi:hypothetical protein